MLGPYRLLSVILTFTKNNWSEASVDIVWGTKTNNKQIVHVGSSQPLFCSSIKETHFF